MKLITLAHRLCPLLGREVRRNRSGQGMVEFGLVAPILIVIIFAIIEFALAIHTQIDFSVAISNGVRTASIHGQSGDDDRIGASMLTGLRTDDRDRIQNFQVQMVQSRNVTGAAALSTYLNIYAFCSSTVVGNASYPDCTSANANNYETSAWDAIAATYPGITPCQYYDEAHLNTQVNKVFMDGHETQLLNATDLAGNYIYPHLDAGLVSGCHVNGSNRDDLKYGDTHMQCDGNNGVPAPTTGIPLYPHGAGYLCYYYPVERANSILGVSLADLLDVSITYKFTPLPLPAAKDTPLGAGFTITEHARGRIEPQSVEG